MTKAMDTHRWNVAVEILHNDTDCRFIKVHLMGKSASTIKSFTCLWTARLLVWDYGSRNIYKLGYGSCLQWGFNTLKLNVTRLF